MWELLTNGMTLTVGNRLRHLIVIGEENETLIQEFEVIAVENLVFSARMTRDNGIDIPIQSQISWFNELARLNELGLQILT